jgi:hypothetical protein
MVAGFGKRQRRTAMAVFNSMVSHGVPIVLCTFGIGVRYRMAFGFSTIATFQHASTLLTFSLERFSTTIGMLHEKGAAARRLVTVSG